MKQMTLLALSAILSVSLYFGISCNSPTQLTVSNPSITEENLIRSDIVNCTILIMNDNGGSGTGVVIQQDKKHAYILTAYHIIKNRNRLWGKQYINNDLQFEELTVVLEDKINDQAILESPPVWAGVANIISEDADIILYSKAFTYGFPATTSGITNGILTEARICLLHDIDLDKKETTVTSIPVSFGNSGGGLFIKKNGHFMLAGVAHCMGAMAGRFDDHYIHHISGYSTGDQLLKILGDFNNRP